MAFKRETLAPMMALIFASCVCILFVLGRIVWTGNYRYIYLAWNLILAWIPLLLALVAEDRFAGKAGGDWRFGALAVSWLVFFPNAPYIFTDLIHLTGFFQTHVWVDLTIILSCALTGFVLGFVSLFLMQGLVRRTWGSATSWVFIAAVAGLSSFGVCLGRFMRFNSWDVLFQPLSLYHHIGGWFAHPVGQRISLGFGLLFAIFTFTAYLMLYGLTQLQPSPALARVSPNTPPRPLAPAGA